jgi:hypothetical protein
MIFMTGEALKHAAASIIEDVCGAFTPMNVGSAVFMSIDVMCSAKEPTAISSLAD